MLQSTPLWYLVQVGNYQSLSIAAEQLHISQPSLSIAIKKLESELGLQLLERTYRGVKLTEDGKKVVALALQAFSYFDEIEKLTSKPLKDCNLNALNDVCIYTNPAFSSLLSSAVAESSSLIPPEINALETHIEPYSIVTDNPNAVVLTSINENTTIPSHIGMEILVKSKTYIMCSPRFSYIPKDQTSISFKELLTIPLIIVKDGFELQDTILRILRLHGTPNIKATTIDVFSMTAMVNNALGASFGSKMASDKMHDDTRYISIRNAPKFLTVLLYNKSISSEKIMFLKNLLKPYML